MDHDFEQLPGGVQLEAPTWPVTRQAGPVACEAGIVALDGVDCMASKFPRHGADARPK